MQRFQPDGVSAMGGLSEALGDWAMLRLRVARRRETDPVVHEARRRRLDRTGSARPWSGPS